jgi:hypothetical protein
VNDNEMVKHRGARFLLSALVLCLGALPGSVRAQGFPTTAKPVSARKSYRPASVRALPELQCKLYPAGSAPSAAVTVFTDDDGYGRFHAVRAVAGADVPQLTMDCRD